MLDENNSLPNFYKSFSVPAKRKRIEERVHREKHILAIKKIPETAEGTQACPRYQSRPKCVRVLVLSTSMLHTRLWVSLEEKSNRVVYRCCLLDISRPSLCSAFCVPLPKEAAWTSSPSMQAFMPIGSCFSLVHSFMPIGLWHDFYSLWATWAKVLAEYVSGNKADGLYMQARGYLSRHLLMCTCIWKVCLEDC